MDYEAVLIDKITNLRMNRGDGLFVCDRWLGVLGFRTGLCLSYLVDIWVQQYPNAKFNPEDPIGQQIPRKCYTNLEKVGLAKIDQSYNLTLDCEKIVKLAWGKLRLKKKGS